MLLFHAAWASPSTSVIGPDHVDGPGYGGLGLPNADHQQSAWFLRWTPFAITRLTPPLHTDFLAYPGGANLMWNTSVPLAGVVAWPLTSLAGPVIAVNTLVTAGVVLAAMTAFVLIRRWTRSRVAAFIGGALFGFSPYMVAHAQAHPNLTLGGALIPLIALLVRDLLEQRRHPIATGSLLGLAGAAQFYLSIEMAAATVVVATIAIAACVAARPRRLVTGGQPMAIALAATLVVGGVVVSPGLAELLAGSQRIAGTIRPPGTVVTDLLNVVVPTGVQQLAPSWALGLSHAWTSNSVEWTGYLGVPLILLTVVCAGVPHARSALRVAVVVTALGVLLSLGPTLHVGGRDTGVPLPWRAIAQIPRLDNILPGRLSVFTALAAALAVALVVDAALVVPRRIGSAARLGVAGLSVAALLPAFSLPAAAMSTPDFFTSDRAQRIPDGSVALVVPFARQESPGPMLWQAVSGMRFRMPEGYVLLPDPRGRAVAEPAPTATSRMLESVESSGVTTVDAATRDAVLADLRRLGVVTVIVGPMRHRDEAVAVMTDLLGRTPEHTGGVDVWWSVH